MIASHPAVVTQPVAARVSDDGADPHLCAPCAFLAADRCQAAWDEIVAALCKKVGL